MVSSSAPLKSGGIRRGNDSCRRVFLFFCFLLFATGVSLIIGALVTQHWIQGHPKRLPPLTNSDEKVSDLETAANDQHYFHAGLFGGTRMLNWGVGLRTRTFWVHEEISEGVSYMGKALWLAVCVFCALAILWSVVGIIFSLINTVVKPVETIVGPLGLYLWSSLALVCSLLAALLFLIQYLTAIRKTVLLPDEITARFTTEDRVGLGYSYWLVVGACVANAVILCLLAVGDISEHRRRSAKPKLQHPYLTANGADMIY